MTVFDELIFGSGAWITLLIIFVLGLVAIKLYRWSGVITGFLFVLMGLKYFQLYSAGDSNYTWFFAFAWICAIFQMLVMVKVKN